MFSLRTFCVTNSVKDGEKFVQNFKSMISTYIMRIHLRMTICSDYTGKRFPLLEHIQIFSLYLIKNTRLCRLLVHTWFGILRFHCLINNYLVSLPYHL